MHDGGPDHGSDASVDLSPDGTVGFDRTWELDADAEGWSYGFADYPPGQETFYELSCVQATLPAEVGPGGGLKVNGNNHSDDLFSYLFYAVHGLAPQTLYRLHMTVVIDTNAPADCGGIGGSPGTGVFVKLGASAIAPAASVDSNGHLRLNIDKGNQSAGGVDMKVVGDLGNTFTCPDQTYQAKTLSLTGFSVRTSSDGSLWLLFGTDSGFEGITTYYVDRISATLGPQ